MDAIVKKPGLNYANKRTYSFIDNNVKKIKTEFELKQEPSNESEEIVEVLSEPSAKNARRVTPERENFDAVIDEAYMECLSQKDICGEARIANLVAILKERAESLKLRFDNFKLLIERLLEKMIVDKKWRGLTVEKTLALSAYGNYEVSEDEDVWQECKSCQASYPPGKYHCECDDKFTNRVFYLTHKVTQHKSKLASNDEMNCKDCNLKFGTDPRSLAIHLRENHLCMYNHIVSEKFVES